jgi:hypothetical protein
MGETNTIRQVKRLKRLISDNRPYAMVVKGSSEEEVKLIVEELIKRRLIREDSLIYGDVQKED